MVDELQAEKQNLSYYPSWGCWEGATTARECASGQRRFRRAPKRHERNCGRDKRVSNTSRSETKYRANGGLLVSSIGRLLDRRCDVTGPFTILPKLRMKEYLPKGEEDKDCSSSSSTAMGSRLQCSLRPWSWICVSRTCWPLLCSFFEESRWSSCDGWLY